MTQQEIHQIQTVLATLKAIPDLSEYTSVTVDVRVRNGAITHQFAYYRTEETPQQMFDITEIENVGLFGGFFINRVNRYGDINTNFQYDVLKMIEAIEERYSRVLMVNEILADLA